MKQNGKFLAGCILSLFLLLAMASFSPIVAASPVGDGVRIQGYGPGDGTGNGGEGPKDGTGNGPGDCSYQDGTDFSGGLILAGKGNGHGHGPGDGTGNDGDGPKDGSGYGPGDCSL